MSLFSRQQGDRKLTKAEFRAEAAKIVQRMSAETGGWPKAQATAEAVKKRKARCLADPFEFFREYLPHYFSCEFAPFQHEIIEMLDVRDEVVVPMAVAAPRDFSKSTLVSFGYTLHQVIFKLRNFAILGSDTEGLAEDLTFYMKLELEHNQRMQHDFGKRVLPRGADGDFITNNSRVLARGSGQRVRGLKHIQHRPDLVILDDLENDKNVKNPRLVKEKLKWIREAVYPAIDVKGSLFIVGTILSKRSALATMIHSPEEPYRHWRRAIYRALNKDADGNLISLWPQRWPVKTLLAQKKEMGSISFNKEKQNDPRDDEGMFREEWLKLYDPAELKGKALQVAGFFDPSTDRGGANDYKAFITVGLDNTEMVYYVLGAFIRRSSLVQLYAAIVASVKAGLVNIPYSVVGMEDNGFQTLAVEGLAGAAKTAKVTLPLRTRTSKLAKETRLAGLSPLVESGVVRFPYPQYQDEDMRLLIEQLIYFPSPTINDDGPDALEGAVDLLKGPGVGVY